MDKWGKSKAKQESCTKEPVHPPPLTFGCQACCPEMQHEQKRKVVCQGNTDGRSPILIKHHLTHTHT